MTRPKPRWTNEPQTKPAAPSRDWLSRWRAMPVGYQILILLGVLFWAGLLFSPRRATETATSPSPTPVPEAITNLNVEVDYQSPFYYVVGSVQATQQCRLLTIRFLWQREGVRVAETVAQYSDVSPGNVLEIRELYTSEQYPDRYVTKYSCL